MLLDVSFLSTRCNGPCWEVPHLDCFISTASCLTPIQLKFSSFHYLSPVRPASYHGILMNMSLLQRNVSSGVRVYTMRILSLRQLVLARRFSSMWVAKCVKPFKLAWLTVMHITLAAATLVTPLNIMLFMTTSLIMTSVLTRNWIKKINNKKTEHYGLKKSTV